MDQHPPPAQDPRADPFCNDRDGDGYGPGCLNGLDCDDRDPLTHTSAAERCDQIDNDCDGQIDEGIDVGTACTLRLATCERDGVVICTPGGRPVCEAFEPLTEVCNGEDDDCDGQTDESGLVDDGEPCQTGLDGRCAVGHLVCLDAAFSCEPDILPASGAEICNGEDDDCDGNVDNITFGNTDPLTRACYQGPPATRESGLCVEGTQTCDTGIGWGPCEGQVLPTLEICDQEDNDCDGVADDLPGTDCTCTPGDERSCYPGPVGTAGVGPCVAGEQECPSMGPATWSACAGAVVPVAELCDEIDNDCDGRTDEGVVGAGVACFSGVGACRVEGELVCSMGALSCDLPMADSPTTETCNDVDDDCDGLVDEGTAPNLVGAACTSGVGACQRAGTYTCVGELIACSVAAAQPGNETCNGIDDDCDASIDEGLGLGNACQVGVGACFRPGVTICGAGGAVVCSAGAGGPIDEICDTIDNDCDGRTDEGLGVGNVCNGAFAGGCGLGVLECYVDGTVKCSTRIGGSDWPMGAYVGAGCTCMDCCEAGTWECLNNVLLCSTEPGGSEYEEMCDP